MNSRERVIASIEHKQLDKVPFDIGSNPSSGISSIAYSKLLKYLGKEHLPVKIFDVVQQLSHPDMEIVDMFGIDIVDIGIMYNTNTNDWHETSLSNGDTAMYPKWFTPEKQANGDYIAKNKNGESIAKMPNKASFFDQTVFPWKDSFPSDMSTIKEAMDKVLWSAFAHSPWDDAANPNFWSNLRTKALNLRQNSDKAIMITVGCNLFEWGAFLRRMDNFLMDPYMYPNETNMLLDALMDIHMKTLEKVVNAVGDIIDIIRFGDDLGMTSGPLMSPDVYREFFKPRHTMLNNYVKKNCQMKTFLHSCGSIYQLIPDLIDAGFDILNPVQTNCINMEPELLKKEFGADITFWGGGVDTTTVLNKSTPKEVRAHCLDRLKIFSPNGGFIFNPVHNIIADVPPENIIAMVNAVKEFNGENLIKV